MARNLSQVNSPPFDLLSFKQNLLNKEFNIQPVENVSDTPKNSTVRPKLNPNERAILFNQILSKLDHNRDSDDDDEPKPWQNPIYSSVREFEADMVDLIDSLRSDNDPHIEFTSPIAKQNFRDLIKNIGDLYVNYLDQKKK